MSRRLSESSQEEPSPPSASFPSAGQYLSFRLGTQRFGVEMFRVVEITRVPELLTVPSVPEHVRGIAKYRGTTIPVVSLRRFVGVEEDETKTKDREACFLVVELSAEAGAPSRWLGCIIDEVHELIEFAQEELAVSSLAGSEGESGALCGIGQRDDQLITLLNVEQVFASATVTDRSPRSAAGVVLS